MREGEGVSESVGGISSLSSCLHSHPIIPHRSLFLSTAVLYCVAAPPPPLSPSLSRRHIPSLQRERINVISGIDAIQATLAYYSVSTHRGFLPATDPLQRLPREQYYLWEDLADDLPKLLSECSAVQCSLIDPLTHSLIHPFTHSLPLCIIYIYIVYLRRHVWCVVHGAWCVVLYVSLFSSLLTGAAPCNYDTTTELA